MSCVLHAVGTGFDVKAFLATSPLRGKAAIQQRDEAVPAPRSERAGFDVRVSEADFDDLATQIDDALEFLDTHEDELRRLAGFPGVDSVALDFAVSWRNVAVQTDSFPPELLWRAGALDISLDISHYHMPKLES
jgi:hypothetical protein